MKKVFLLIFILVVSGFVLGIYMSLSHLLVDGQRTIVIVAVEPMTNTEVLRGMGYRVDDTTIVTSAHVVPDDRYVYRVLSGDKISDILTVQSRLSERDVAILSPSGKVSGRQIGDIFTNPSLKAGDNVYIPVFRSGALIRLTAKIQNVTTQVIAYNHRGQIQVFSGIILPDIPFLPGDSGAPIFTRWGKLIDVVHVGE